MKEQRTQRIEELKVAMRDMVRKNHPEVRPDIEIELHPDAAIELFGMGVLDGPQEEWTEFLDSIRKGEPVPVGEEELNEEERSRLKH